MQLRILLSSNPVMLEMLMVMMVAAVVVVVVRAAPGPPWSCTLPCHAPVVKAHTMYAPWVP